MYNNYDDGYGFDLVQMVKVNDDIYITCEMLFQHHRIQQHPKRA